MPFIFASGSRTLTPEGSEIKFADFLREILLAITLEAFTQSRVRNSEYKSTAMKDFMRSVKHCTQFLIIGAHCVD